MINYLKKMFYFLSILCIISCEKEKSETSPNIEITACFTTTEKTYLVNGPVTFTNCSENGSHYWWTFGDEDYSSSKEENAIFTFTKAGSYNTVLVASYKEIIDSNNDMIIDEYDNLSKPYDMTGMTITIK